MKVCPICQARTFNDAAVCYGCMHRYEEDRPLGSPVADDAAWEPDDGLRPPVGPRTAPPPVGPREACLPGQEGGPHAPYAPAPRRVPAGRRGDEAARPEGGFGRGAAGESGEAEKATSVQPLEKGSVAKSKPYGAQEPLASRESMLVRVELPQHSGRLASPPESAVFEKTVVLPTAHKQQTLSFPLVISIMPALEGGMRHDASPPEHHDASPSHDDSGGLSLREVVGA